MMDLRDYEQRKFAIAEVLRAGQRLAPRDRRDWHDRAQELFARLAEDRFNLVVVGRFSRGKTSLMNAILGTDRLPTGILPLTSVITTVGYGSSEKVVLSFEERILTHEISIDELARYVTEQGNPGNVQRIKRAEVQLPAEILRRGFYFVDTPGLGSAIAENTRTTEAFLPEADAFLLVSSYESPLSEEEMRFFRMAASSGRQIFLVLNKQDTATHAERRAAVSFVRAQLSCAFPQQPVRVFSVSARDGLKAKQMHDLALLDESGLAGLERELVAFLLVAKSEQFLLRMSERAAELVQRLPRRPETDELRKRSDALRRQIVTRLDVVAPEILPMSGESLHQIRSCEICAHVGQVLWNFLSRFQYELSTGEAEKKTFADSGGLCTFHTWQYEAVASPQGTCIGYTPLLDRLARLLREMAQAKPQNGGLDITNSHDLLAHRDDCPMCAVRAEAEAQAVARTAARIQANPQEIQSLSAICLPHLSMLLATLEGTGLNRELLEREAAILERLAEDMRRYALKRDGVKRHLLSDEETKATHQALLLLVGARNVNPIAEGHPGSRRARVPHASDDTLLRPSLSQDSSRHDSSREIFRR